MLGGQFVDFFLFGQPLVGPNEYGVAAFGAGLDLIVSIANQAFDHCRPDDAPESFSPSNYSGVGLGPDGLGNITLAHGAGAQGVPDHGIQSIEIFGGHAEAGHATQKGSQTAAPERSDVDRKVSRRQQVKRLPHAGGPD